MDNGDATQGHAMTSAEFAKLMGAYPQPAENPLPAYGGYMDDSPANFSFVNMNDNFGADERNIYQMADIYEKQARFLRPLVEKAIRNGCFDKTTSQEIMDEGGGLGLHLVESDYFRDAETFEAIQDGRISKKELDTLYAYVEYLEGKCGGNQYDEFTDAGLDPYRTNDAETFEAPYAGAGSLFGIGQNTGIEGFTTSELTTSSAIHGDFDEASLNYSGHQNFEVRAETEKLKLYTFTYSAMEGGIDYLDEEGNMISVFAHTPKEALATAKEDLKEMENDTVYKYIINPNYSLDNEYNLQYDAETNKEVMYVKQMKEEFYDKKNAYEMYEERTHNYGYFTSKPSAVKDAEESKAYYESKGYYVELFEGNSGVIYVKTTLNKDISIETRVVISYSPIVKLGAETFNGLSAEEYYAEMEELDDGVASITNRFGDSVGVVQVDDEDLEDVSVEITDGDGDVVYEGILGDEDVPEMEEDDFYYSENNTKKSKSIGLLALGALAGVLSYPTVLSLFTKKEEKAAETPELIESPNTGNLDPAQYEELVVESTGYAVDVIPQGLDGSFMGSRFAALPTERYVEYNEPGIGAHTDIALSRDEMYLEPEMAMVQASESVKESQAPGQSPYNSMTGEENADFDMRVLKETEVVSLDPAVKPFIPQSMSGYTGNANTPPSVFNKMFNVGVLGQTPAFVPGSGDMGSSHTGSRSATPNALGLGGSVGGPLSDQVNSNYTDGTTSMSLAQWAIENTVSQTSDTEAVVIDRSSGQMKRVRRV